MKQNFKKCYMLIKYSFNYILADDSDNEIQPREGDNSDLELGNDDFISKLGQTSFTQMQVIKLLYNFILNFFVDKFNFKSVVKKTYTYLFMI